VNFCKKKNEFIVFCVAVHDQRFFTRQNFTLSSFMKIRYGMCGVGGNPCYGWMENGSDYIILVTDKYN
jgi:hypothetical protein